MLVGILSPWFGLGIGAVVGAAAFLSNFCFLGGVSDILFARDWRRMRAWMLAAGVALLATQALDTLGLVAIDPVLRPNVLWLPALLGGTCFGFGMALAGGCVNRALVRIGAGSVKSLVIVSVVAFVSVLTFFGALEPLGSALARVGSFELMVAPEGLHRVIGAFPAFDSKLVQCLTTAVIASGLIAASLADAWFRHSKDQWIAGLLIGLAIPAAWAATGGVQALNFAGPLGGLALALAVGGPLVTFGTFSVIGVPVGSFIAAAATRNLALESFTDRADLPRNLIGAALMGFGGTIALGCTFGQGLSGLSTLSITAMLTIAAIIFGCLWGIRYFEAGGVWAGLKMALKRGV